MKHIYLAPALFLLCGSLSAQFSLTTDNMPLVGDEIIRYLDTVPDLTPGGDGPAQTWDLGAAIQDLEQVNTFVDPATTPDADQFGGSNLAWTTDGSNYSYITNSAGSLTLDGFSGDPLGDGSFTVVAPFDPVMMLHEFPRQHTSAFTSAFGFDVTVDGSDFGVYQGRIKETAIAYDTTDSYGIITTPVGSYNCLRSRSVTVRTDSVFVQLLDILPMTFAFTTVDTTVTYAWHTLETKLPVAEMVVDSLGAAVSFTWSSIEPTSTAIHADPASVSMLSIFPQPAMEQVRITIGGAAPVAVTVHDLEGRTALSTTRMASTGLLDLSTLPSGIYVVNATDVQGQRFSQRLVHVSGR